MPKYSLIENYSLMHPRRSTKLPLLSFISEIKSECSTNISFIVNSPTQTRGFTRDLRMFESMNKKKHKSSSSNVTTRPSSITSKISKHPKIKDDTKTKTKTKTKRSKIAKKYNQAKPKQETISFTQTNTDQPLIFKSFKENQFPINSIKDIPSINWMKMDNDVSSDEEQIEYGRSTLFKKLGETIDKESKEVRYFQRKLSRTLKYAPMSQQSHKQC